ncbi:MAG: alkaline phosphatase family protein [Bacteroidia bacterium]|nr:alkaline phosphatase family protein [Bacteroidia bacterium]
MKRSFFCLYSILLLGVVCVRAQNTKPKLIVGIVVDQMRNDYIYRYWDRYGNGGFKRLVNEGFHFQNAHYNYIPTYTGPGHCSIYTGATPRVHGIIGNDWFQRENGKFIYCAEDTSVKTIGSESKAGLMSPKNQLSSTIGDELKMSTQQKAKVFGIALKDRSSILPAGHAANAAFWFDDKSGGFISSTWYVQELPGWLKNFNAKKTVKTYLEKGWTTLYPIETYSNSISDDNAYEAAPKKEKPVFPYDYKTFIEKNSWGIIKATPMGNSITKDLALLCLREEQLGKDEICDLLCISFSSPDYVGHAYGLRAVETEDIYLRLDKEIEEILNALDKEVGKNNYTVFLTADHGAADVPKQLLDNKIPGGYINEKTIIREIKNFLKTNYGDTLLFSSISNEQVYLNETLISKMKLNKEDLETALAAQLVKTPGIAEAFSSSTLMNGSFDARDYRRLLQNGFNHKLSGNIAYIYQPAWLEHEEKGTTHGAGYNYDTHVPVVFYGNGVKKGKSQTYTTITQIAPTICELLKINQPNSTTSDPLNDFFK